MTLLCLSQSQADSIARAGERACLYRLALDCVRETADTDPDSNSRQDIYRLLWLNRVQDKLENAQVCSNRWSP